LRRLEPLHIALAGLWGVGMTLAALANRSQGIGVVLALLVWAAAGFSLGYLMTVSASVRVTPTHVLVNNPYVQHSIPRHLITGVSTKGYWIPRLLIDGGPAVRLVVLDRNLPRGHDVGPSHHQAQLIMRMIAETPAQDGPAGVSRRWRIGNLAIAALTAIGWVGACVYLLSTVSK
jgi:hypothetical protein